MVRAVERGSEGDVPHENLGNRSDFHRKTQRRVAKRPPRIERRTNSGRLSTPHTSRCAVLNRMHAIIQSGPPLSIVLNEVISIYFYNVTFFIYVYVTCLI